MKKIAFLSLLVPVMQYAQQTDSLVILSQVIKEDRVPIEQMPLVCDQNDSVLWGSIAFSGLGLGLAGLYRMIAEPAGFDLIGCRNSYYLALSNQSHETGYPCDWKSNDFSSCLYKLTVKFCGEEQDQYDQTIPEKQLMAWVPLITVATASAAFTGGWLAGKAIARAWQNKIPFKAGDSTAIQMKEML